MDIWIHGSAPVHSKTTSKPSSSPNCDIAEEMFSFARLSCSSVVLALSADGRQWTSSAKPLVLAKLRRPWLMSMATTFDAPDAFASEQARRPIAPTPNTRTVCPDCRLARREACSRTDNGSARAAWSNEQLSGSLGMEVSERKRSRLED